MDDGFQGKNYQTLGLTSWTKREKTEREIVIFAVEFQREEKEGTFQSICFLLVISVNFYKKDCSFWVFLWERRKDLGKASIFISLLRFPQKRIGVFVHRWK